MAFKAINLLVSYSFTNNTKDEEEVPGSSIRELQMNPSPLQALFRPLPSGYGRVYTLHTPEGREGRGI
jgi:hypothetical protein